MLNDDETHQPQRCKLEIFLDELLIDTLYLTPNNLLKKEDSNLRKLVALGTTLDTGMSQTDGSKGCVYYFSGKDPNQVDIAVQSASEKGAFAILVLCSPSTELSTLPVFVLSGNTLLEEYSAKKLKDSRIIIQKIDSSDGKEDTFYATATESMTDPEVFINAANGVVYSEAIRGKVEPESNNIFQTNANHTTAEFKNSITELETTGLEVFMGTRNDTDKYWPPLYSEVASGKLEKNNVSQTVKVLGNEVGNTRRNATKGFAEATVSVNQSKNKRITSGAPKPENKGVLQKMKAATKAAGNAAKDFAKDIGLISPESWSTILGDLSGWDRPPHKRYGQAFDRLDEAVNGERNETVEFIGQEVLKILQLNNISLLQLVFASAIYLKERKPHDLAISVIRLMHKQKANDPRVTGYAKKTHRFFDNTDRKPHNVLHCFFGKVFKSWEFLSPDFSHPDEFLVCILTFWDKCNLYREKNPADWNCMRRVLKGKFFDSNKDELEVAIGKNETMFLGMSICQGKSQMIDRLKEYHVTKNNIPVKWPFIDELIDTGTHEISCLSGDLDKSRKWWEEIFTILEFVNDTSSRKVFTQLISQWSYQELGTFKIYEIVSDVLDKKMFNYHRRTFLNDILDESLHSDLCFNKNRKLSTDEFLGLIGHPKLLTRFLDHNQRSEAFVQVACSIVHRQSSFIGKLEFVANIYCCWFPRRNEIVLRLVKYARTTESDHKDTFREIFEVVKRKPDIFKDCDQDFLRELSHALIQDRDGMMLLQTQSVLGNTLTYVDNPNKLYEELFRRVRDVISAVAPSINLASIFYLKASQVSKQASSGTDNVTQILEIAVFVFEKAFLHWNPSSIGDIVAQESETLDTMFRCLQDAPLLISHSECIERLLLEWHSAFESDNVDNIFLHRSIAICEKASWRMLNSNSNYPLPDAIKINEKLNEIKTLMEKISDNFLAPDKSSVLYVLKQYNCIPLSHSPLGVLISDHKELLDKKSKEISLSLSEEASNNRKLKDLRKDLEIAVEFRRKYDSVIVACHYFLNNPSAVFRKHMASYTKKALSLHTLSEAITNVIDKVRELFGPKTTFKDVDEAMKVVLSSNITLDQELSVLTGFEALGLVNEDKDRFQAIAMMSCFSEPLDQFVNFCRQFRFSVIDSSNFNELAKIADELVRGDIFCLGAIECMNFSERLCRLLCSDSANYSSSSVLSSKAKQRLPCIGVLAKLSSQSEIMSFVREMKWDGNDGLKRFYEEYGNVTNVLLGNTVSYEMSVLDALEPAIRAISFISGLQDDTDVISFLNALENSSDVTRCYGEGGKCNDLVQAQENLSQIRDWFTNGLDEVAAVFGLFEAVCKSGMYRIDHGYQNDPELVLRYKLDWEEKTIKADELTQLVQHVSLIQNEDADIEAEVTSFVEQFQTLTKAAEIQIRMMKLGFGTDIGMFTCTVGRKYAEQSKSLLQASNAELRLTDTKMRQLTEIYPASLLFSTNELRQIHKLLSIGRTCNVEIWKDVARMTFHLISESVCFELFVKTVATHAKSYEEVVHKRERGWLHQVSKFAEELLRSFGDHAIQRSLGEEQNSRIVVHTVALDEQFITDAILQLFRCIFKDRLPRKFEVLDAMDGCTPDHLDIFLRRAQTFTSNIFVVMNADMLSGNLPEKLVSFLSRREVVTSGICLHCIQRRPSLLHSGPWIEILNWDQDSLLAELSKVGVDAEYWMNLMVNPHSIREVTIFWTPTSGTGKTRFIKDQIDKLLLTEQVTEAATVVIHEHSSSLSLIEDMKSKFSPREGERAVHFSFCYMPKRCSEAKLWLESINRFFFSLLVLRSVHDQTTGRSFHLGERCWRLFVELPSQAVSGPNWLRQNIPVLSFCGTARMPNGGFIIDPETRRVCTYLRALRDKKIDRKFEMTTGRLILFILDWSGSMEGGPLNAATDNALRLFDSHVHIGDRFGVTMFNSRTSIAIPIQEITTDQQKTRIRARLNLVRKGGSVGTDLYSAVLTTLNATEGTHDVEDTWVICLTDGESSEDNKSQLRDYLVQSSNKIRIMVIGINLAARLEEAMRVLCGKYQCCESGYFVPSGGTLADLNTAFARVASRIPVSQTFEIFDGVVTDGDCRELLRKYTESFLNVEDQLLLNFWVRFLYRRVKVFDMNTDFNENVKYESLGSTLMEMMLEEAERLLAENQSKDWVGKNHSQLVYDFSDQKDPKFRLVCTSPDDLDEHTRQKYEMLDLPGFKIPTNDELTDRGTLDRYISQALGVPLQNTSSGEERLACIDDYGFILTLDFTIKLLNIHERVACRLPCLIEGETGVSKTALTRMYSILRNSSMKAKVVAQAENAVLTIEADLRREGFELESGATPLERLQQTLTCASQKSIGDETEIAGALYRLLIAQHSLRSCVFQSIPDEFNINDESRTTAVRSLLDWFVIATLEPTFFDINVDASLTEFDIVRKFGEIRLVARKLLNTEALVVVFLDEINTTSVMGLFKEIVVDCSIMGDRLEENIVVIAACNPYRTQATTKGACLQENDLGKEWASGHYQVVELPPSLEKVKWAYGSLTHNQEKDFILRRMEKISGGSLTPSLRRAMTEVVSASHEAMRKFASQNILSGLQRVGGDQHAVLDAVSANDASLSKEVEVRAKSVVSLRDIQRVFGLYQFFTEDFDLLHSQRESMILAVAIVYYFRLDDESRSKFRELIASLSTERYCRTFQTVLDEAMDTVARSSAIPPGIALTRGLKENIFMTLSCLLSRTPLLIVGPPGSSKTLAVNVISDNANGEDSPSEFFRKYPRLSLYHYQCSKESTSKEIAAVFEKAIQRQEKCDPLKQLSFVFMDEAGLPEEEKESLKVLHYLLEGHMSAKSKVGFVAISNHVLDAAKSNRCAMLLRQDPDTEDMLSITRGILFDSRESSVSSYSVELDDEHYDAERFAFNLCSCYGSMATHFEWFERVFGLRDYIYFLKALRVLASFEVMKMKITKGSIVRSVERNFNGVGPKCLKELALFFLKSISGQPQAPLIESLIQSLRDPMDVIRESLSSSDQDSDLATRARYKLIIDKTEDDSIMRLLNAVGILELDMNSLLKLSQLPEDVGVERMRLVSSVKYAALQGKLVVLSQTEPVNEAMYDLFNQRFRKVASKLYANIAVEGISRRCLVHPNFECIVHVRESQLHLMPAPFLNRFEKYSLGTEDVLNAGLMRLGKISTVFRAARARVMKFILIVGGEEGMFGMMDKQTIDSLFIDLLPSGALSSLQGMSTTPCLSSSEPSNFCQCLVEFLHMVTSLQLSAKDVQLEIELAKDILRPELSSILHQLTIQDECDSINIMQSLISSLKVGFDESPLTEIGHILLQMVVTRVALTRLMQIATPEAIYLNKLDLPEELVGIYFSQEHFSLKRLLASRVAAFAVSKKVIIHTRSNAAIRSLPSLSPHNETSSPSLESLDQINELVYPNAAELIIEHVSNLRSETAMRGSIEGWLKDDNLKIYLLLLDMGETNSVEHANYIRSFVEHKLEKNSNKVFAMLLHFPPSISNKTGCYPALFLQGWEHIYLDGVGRAGDMSTFDVDECIKIACSAEFKHGKYSARSAQDLSIALKSTLPRIMQHVAANTSTGSHKVAMDGSNWLDASYHSRCQFLLALIERQLGDSSVGSMLCEKFVKLWLDRTLLKTMKRASEGLMTGRTQLSLSMSVRTNLIDSFSIFVSSLIYEMNRGGTLDIIANDLFSGNIEALVGLIVRDLPVPSFEELSLLNIVIRRNDNSQKPYKFPFFLFVSSCLEDLLECVLKDTAKSFNQLSTPETCEILHSRAIETLEDTVQETIESVANQRRLLVLETMRLVSKEEASDFSLFERYLSAFVNWKTNGNSSTLLLDWIRHRLKSFGNSNDIFAIHVVAKLDEREFLSLASWSNLPSTPLDSTSDINIEGLGRGTFALLLDKCERVLYDETNREDWTTLFEHFLRQIDPLLKASGGIDSKVTEYRLRVLSFLYILLRSGVPESTEASALCLWYNAKSLKLQDDNAAGNLSSLQTFIDLLNNNEESSSGAILLAFRFFFSSLWMNLTKRYQIDDFKVLVEYIVETGFRDSYIAASVLHSAFCSFEKEVNESNTVKGGIPCLPLLLVCLRLQSNHVAQYPDTRIRFSLPHIIPQWLNSFPEEEDDSDYLKAEGSDILNTFVADYNNCFDGQLSEALFVALLRSNAQRARNLSSEDMLLDLLERIEKEASLSQDQLSSAARLRSLDISSASLSGSLVSAIDLDSSLVCLVAKIALELSIDGTSLALTGTYGIDGRHFLEKIMSIPGYSLDVFFFNTIQRVRGESTMAALLGQDKPLHRLSWCQSWVEGRPQVRSDSQHALESAEHALAEAQVAEDRKSREIRLCPHCHNHFMVDQMNCGHFTCGQDAHGGVGGTNVQGGYGCGQEFNINTAQRYALDENILAPLRSRVVELRTNVLRCENNATSWDRARTMEVPVLELSIDRGAVGSHIFPTAFVIDRQGDSQTSSVIVSLLLRLRDGSDFVFQHQALPDLIELYMWLHSTFRYLVTLEEARSLQMREIMDEKRLQNRFGIDSASHIVELWRRSSKALNDFLHQTNGRIFWQCDEITLPFRNVEDAPLLALLSEGPHPTDGHDYLFIIINSIVDRYNNFVRWLGDYDVNSQKHTECALHPKFVIRGRYGAVAISALVVMPKRELYTLVESAWNAFDKEYDMDWADDTLKHELILQFRRQLIMNPLDYLRERFVFREEGTSSNRHSDLNTTISRDRDGILYFANVQDVQLYNALCEKLNQFSLGGSSKIRRTIGDTFHNFDYDGLRSLLEGIRNLLHLPETAKGVDGSASVERILCSVYPNVVPEKLLSEIELVIERHGFPKLNRTQIEFLLSLQPQELAELVYYVGYQLASECFLFSGLPLCLKEPLVNKELSIMAKLYESMKTEKGTENFISLLDEFTQNVFTFYQVQICREVSSSFQSIRDFLIKNNCCDTSDPVFAIIPQSATLRHYVSIRGHLHQLKLSSLFDEEKLISSHTAPVCTENAHALETCWLWDGDNITMDGLTESVESNYELPQINPDLLWFARDHFDAAANANGLSEEALFENPGSMSIDENVSAVGEVPETILVSSKSLAAKKIQFWWRRARASVDTEVGVMNELFIQYSAQWEILDEEEKSLNLESVHSSNDTAKIDSTPIEQSVSQDGTHQLQMTNTEHNFPTEVAGTSTEALLYGEGDWEYSLRRWFSNQRLPPSVSDIFINLGARDFEDIITIVNELKELLQKSITCLDLLKLKKAIIQRKTE